MLAPSMGGSGEGRRRGHRPCRGAVRCRPGALPEALGDALIDLPRRDVQVFQAAAATMAFVDLKLRVKVADLVVHQRPPGTLSDPERR